MKGTPVGRRAPRTVSMEGTPGGSTFTPDSVNGRDSRGSTCTTENANAPEKRAMRRKNTDYFKDNIYWSQK